MHIGRDNSQLGRKFGRRFSWYTQINADFF